MSALESISHEASTGSLTDKIYTLLVKGLLVIGCRTFGANLQSSQKYLQNPVVKRGVSSVLRGIQEYGIVRPQLLASPSLVVWNLTNAYNLKCKHCYQAVGKRLSDELTLDEKLSVVKQLSDSGVVAVAFSGGEPPSSHNFKRETTKSYPYVSEIRWGIKGIESLKRIIQRLDLGTSSP